MTDSVRFFALFGIHQGQVEYIRKDNVNAEERIILEERNIYKDIAERTHGDIYIGVVGPVRTGKSTFIKQFMDAMVLPNITDASLLERATDELPQASAGRTIMTTEPKFIPEEAVEITLPSQAQLRVRMIDCVGYIVPSSLGYIEGDAPRMVKTPWFDEAVPFNLAAETGTQKVITEHSTIGLVVTTDGSISDIPREEYAEAEARVINELRELGKPFIVLLNSKNPRDRKTRELALELTAQYGVPVLPVNCMELDEAEITMILSQILFEFPLKEVSVDLPKWITALAPTHWLRSETLGSISELARPLKRVRDITDFAGAVSECANIKAATVGAMDLANGSAKIIVTVAPELFYKILAEETGFEIESEQTLLNRMKELAQVKIGYDRLKSALDEVEATGYGIVMPNIEDLTLEEPEIMKQGGRYGIRLRASAPSIHMMKANIQTEVAPIVGSESQSEELITYLLREFEENPAMIWESNIFGKSLHELVNEGLHNKLFRMPTDARMKLQETLEKVINEGCSGLICIIL